LSEKKATSDAEIIAERKSRKIISIKPTIIPGEREVNSTI
jgi:hypothetical protein